MSSTYIKFKMPKSSDHESDTGTGTKIFETLILKPLTYFIPKANPDFEGKIMYVAEWLLEFESTGEIPSREIGIDEKGETVMIMPWNNNYGFWTDNNLKFQDFTFGFEIRSITQEEFESRWRSFEARNF